MMDKLEKKTCNGKWLQPVNVMIAFSLNGVCMQSPKKRLGKSCFVSQQYAQLYNKTLLLGGTTV